jgi:hypothetical protein
MKNLRFKGKIMKVILILIVTFYSVTSFAFVESKNCPERFSITYYDINRDPLTKEIAEDPRIKEGWDSVKKEQKFEVEFVLFTRSDTALCVYSNNMTAAFLQTNNGLDELMIPYKNNLYFRTKVLSFSREYIELAVDEESKDIYAPILQPDSDGGSNQIGEVEVGGAQAVNIQVIE